MKRVSSILFCALLVASQQTLFTAATPVKKKRGSVIERLRSLSITTEPATLYPIGGKVLGRKSASNKNFPRSSSDSTGISEIGARPLNDLFHPMLVESCLSLLRKKLEDLTPILNRARQNSGKNALNLLDGDNLKILKTWVRESHKEIPVPMFSITDKQALDSELATSISLFSDRIAQLFYRYIELLLPAEPVSDAEFNVINEVYLSLATQTPRTEKLRDTCIQEQTSDPVL